MASKRKDLTLDLKYEVINNIIIILRKIIGASLASPSQSSWLLHCSGVYIFVSMGSTFGPARAPPPP